VANATHYYVRRNASVMTPDHKQLLTPGIVVSEGKHGFSRLDLEGHVRSGFMGRVLNTLLHDGTTGAILDDGTPLDEQPGQKPVPLPIDGTGSRAERRLLEGEMIDLRSDPVPEARVQSVGKWNLDPKVLGKKALRELNAMVAERDTSIGSYETKEEAIVKLSEDWRA